MTWLHPLLLGGLAAASLPILIHLIGKRRAPTIHFAAMDFLVTVNKRLARREKLRQFLLLLLRTLAIIALVLAAARPIKERFQTPTSENQQVALVFDTSASMNYRLGGSSLLDRAKVRAKQVLSRLQPGQPATLVLSGKELLSPVQATTVDHDMLARRIDGVQRGAGTADLGAAIETAVAQLGEGAPAATIVVIGDLASNSFATLAPLKVHPAPRIRLIDVAERSEDGSLTNVAIRTVTVESTTEGPTVQSIHVEVHNFGPAPITRQAVVVEVDGEEVQRGYVDVPAQGRAEKTLTLKLKQPGIFRVLLRLVGADSADPDQGYTADDKAAVLVHAVPPMRLLLVNGDPRTVPYEDELFFLERALEALPQGASPIAITTTTLDELAATALGDRGLQEFDAVVIGHVQSFGSEEAALVARLTEFVREGGGLLLTLGGRSKFEGLNDGLGPLLVTPLRDLFRAQNEREGSPPVSIATLARQHPILRSLDENVATSLRASRTASYFNVVTGTQAARTVLRFENGAPALLERRHGKGVLMLWTTSIDRDLSDIPLRTAFVPLIQRVVRYLGGSKQPLNAGVVRQGSPVELPVPTGARGMAVTTPEGTREVLEVGRGTSANTVLSFNRTSQQGWYTVETEQENGWQTTEELSFAVAASLEESDFVPIDEHELHQRLVGDGDGEDNGTAILLAGATDSDPFDIRGYASFLLLGLSLAFIGESLLAARA